MFTDRLRHVLLTFITVAPRLETISAVSWLTTTSPRRWVSPCKLKRSLDHHTSYCNRRGTPHKSHILHSRFSSPLHATRLAKYQALISDERTRSSSSNTDQSGAQHLPEMQVNKEATLGFVGTRLLPFACFEGRVSNRESFGQDRSGLCGEQIVVGGCVLQDQELVSR